MREPCVVWEENRRWELRSGFSFSSRARGAKFEAFFFPVLKAREWVCGARVHGAWVFDVFFL